MRHIILRKKYLCPVQSGNILLPAIFILMMAVSVSAISAYGKRRSEKIVDLPEVLVKSHKNKMLHLLGYVREYSTLSSYTDTIFLFREKLVDFMLPSDSKMHYKGWSSPRVINSKSYYHFTNAHGLDSVSDESNYHFSWSDWLGVLPACRMPSPLRKVEIGTDTLHGKYSPVEIWRKDGENVSIDVNVLADTVARKWVPNLSLFFRRNTDFEEFNVKFNYDNVLSGTIFPVDLTGYSFSIDSKERGHTMFRFGRVGEPCYVTTKAEVYILDREFVSVKEAKKWEKHDFKEDEIDIYVPAEAPTLSNEILALMERVDKIDKAGVRLLLAPDERLGSIDGVNFNYSLGNRLLWIIKDLTGISKIRGKRNVEKKWKQFRNDWRQRRGMDNEK